MKKLLVLLFVFSIFPFMTYAQMQAGIKAGLNLANLSGDGITNTDTRTGFSGGAFFMYQFGEIFAIQPEVYYSMKGASQKESSGGISVDVDIKLDYFEIPVLLKLLIPLKGSSVKPFVFAGPALAFNTTAKVKGEGGGVSAEIDIKDEIKSTDFGLVFGGGVGFPVGKGELGFDARYILGLSTIDDTTDPDEIKTGVFNFNIYYGFSF